MKFFFFFSFLKIVRFICVIPTLTLDQYHQLKTSVKLFKNSCEFSRQGFGKCVAGNFHLSHEWSSEMLFI
jgi:hypothetical protein